MKNAILIEENNIRNTLKRDITDIIELYSNGKSTLKIGEMYAVNQSVIAIMLKRSGIVLRSMSEASLITRSYKEQDVVNLYQLGLNKTKIGKLFNAAPNTVKRVLLKNNIEIRNNHEAALIKKKIKHILIMSNEEIFKLVKN